MGLVKETDFAKGPVNSLCENLSIPFLNVCFFLVRDYWSVGTDPLATLEIGLGFVLHLALFLSNGSKLERTSSS